MSLFRKKEPEWWEKIQGMSVTFEFNSEYCGEPMLLQAEFSIQGELATLRKLHAEKGWLPHQAEQAKEELRKRLRAIRYVETDL